MTASQPPSAWGDSARETSSRAEWWRLRGHTLHFPARPLVMGILNVTPDSFSDGGQHFDRQTAIDHAIRLAKAGADILDVGGESTRPYSTPVTEQEELDRVVPVLEALRARVMIPVSIDTSKPAVARAAVAAGAEIINDITGLSDPGMVELARSSQVGVCVMHMRGTPQTMQDNPVYDDVVGEVFAYLQQRRDVLAAAGIARERIALDPGIGFGKTHQHNLMLLAHCRQFHALGCPVLVGHSRKGFIGKVLGDKAADPLAGTIGVSLALASQGVQILRVHDVAAVRQALALYEAAGGLPASITECK